ncbi:hypothetical protein LCGC14_3053870 [marine sediment metagenome]|uniref:DUF1064 domain-containing protein n=1 Tax=marine sediment metagenome TaxID=412755 RepID=A0A0F8WKW3_9ZZZZ
MSKQIFKFGEKSGYIQNATSTFYDGRHFRSKKEAGYAQHLDILKKADDPAERVAEWEYEPHLEVTCNGKRVFTYKIDFKVTYADGRIEYVEIKGFETAYFKLKFKIVEAVNNNFQDLDGHGEGAVFNLNIEPFSDLIIIK